MIPFPASVHFAIIKQIVKDNGLEGVVEFKTEEAGKYAHILHLGSYHNEKASIGKVMELIDEKDLSICGNHREVYLKDPNKTEEQKLETILRYRVS